MFMNDVHKKDEIKEFVIQDLRRLGVKYRRKKSKAASQDHKNSVKCFKTDLHFLPTQVVTLNDGQQLVVPVVLHDLCSFILRKVDTEGLFRKEGSKSRQNEIKLSLNAGCKLEEDYHVIDVAGILKTFLRELPEPLIPTMFHDYFLRCSILDKGKSEAILLLCLLIPQVHLNTLAYLLRFFSAVSKHSTQNKMNALNLAIVVGPNIVPFQQDKTSYTTQHKIQKICELIQLLIENAHKVGMIPSYIIDQVAGSSMVTEDHQVVDKKKKRRSGSLTRMFSGLKKIVGSKSDDVSPTIVTPDLLMTPSISRSVKKRKLESCGVSNKTKKEVISKLPEGKLLNVPFNPVSTPISENPNPKTDKRKNLLKSATLEKTSQGKEKKSQWYTRNKSTKHSKAEGEENIGSSRTSLGPRSLIERRWSAVSSVAAFRKSKKRTSYGGSQHNLQTEPSNENVENLEDYVKISKVEYEQIKNRVSAIERRISMEIDNAQFAIEELKEDKSERMIDPVQNVQTAYEQTLVQAKPLSPGTDQLARRLSRELKIRRSQENKVIRSPSARKIGNLKRRSRELERQTGKLSRNQSWHMGSETPKRLIPRVSLRKERSNSLRSSYELCSNDSVVNYSSTPNERVLRSSTRKINSSSLLTSTEERSFHSVKSRDVLDGSGHWTSADRFFSTAISPSTDGKTSNSRPSVAKLRSQNAGMVLAKAKLFDNLMDSDNSITSNQSNKSNSKVKTTYKIGGVRQTNHKLGQKAKDSRNEDKKIKTSSPRRNRLNLSNRQKLSAAKQMVEKHRLRNLSDGTPDNGHKHNSDKDLASSTKYTQRRSPLIKKTLLMTRSPKRLCKTPYIDKRTPLKVFTPRPMEC